MLRLTQNPADLAARIADLERRQRMLQPSAALAVIVTLASLVAFAAKDPEIVKAQRVELVDLKGQTQAVLAADARDVILTLVDKNGQLTSSLRLNDDPRLTVRDATGREVAGLGAPRAQHLTE